jgi:hypothetical protein
MTADSASMLPGMLRSLLVTRSEVQQLQQLHGWAAHGLGMWLPPCTGFLVGCDSGAPAWELLRVVGLQRGAALSQHHCPHRSGSLSVSHLPGPTGRCCMNANGSLSAPAGAVVVSDGVRQVDQLLEEFPPDDSAQWEAAVRGALAGGTVPALAPEQASSCYAAARNGMRISTCDCCPPCRPADSSLPASWWCGACRP